MQSKLRSHLSVLKQTSSPLNNPLIQLWAKRYVPDLSTHRSQTSFFTISELSEVASPSGRAKTVAKLERLLHNNSEFAGIRTNALFTYIPKIVNLAEAKELSPCVTQLYEKALAVYLQQSPTLSSLLARPVVTSSDFSPHKFNISRTVYMEWTEPMLEQLVTVLQPILWHLREQVMLASDQRTLGFMTTQFHFSSKLLLEKLTPAEQVLLIPYFKFIEEQVAIPWQQVCTAAAQYSPDSPTIKIINQLLPATHEIAHIVYRKGAQVYSDHRSRRGDLSQLGVINSTIRDLEMFQIYLWLCFLEKNMASVEQTLLPMCDMVFPSIGVTWELVRQMLRFLVNEIMDRLEPAESVLLFPYTQSLQEMFSQAERNTPKFSKDLHKVLLGK